MRNIFFYFLINKIHAKHQPEFYQNNIVHYIDDNSINKWHYVDYTYTLFIQTATEIDRHSESNNNNNNNLNNLQNDNKN